MRVLHVIDFVVKVSSICDTFSSHLRLMKYLK